MAWQVESLGRTHSCSTWNVVKYTISRAVEYHAVKKNAVALYVRTQSSLIYVSCLYVCIEYLWKAASKETAVVTSEEN